MLSVNGSTCKSYSGDSDHQKDQRFDLLLHFDRGVSTVLFINTAGGLGQ